MVFVPYAVAVPESRVDSGEITNVKILVWDDCKALWAVKKTKCTNTPQTTKHRSKVSNLPSQGVFQPSIKVIRQYISTKSWDNYIAYKVMMAESCGRVKAYNPHNKNGSTDKGIFQINSVHKKTNLYNWQHNIDVAFNIYKSRNNWDSNGWKAWSSYNNGRYKKDINKLCPYR